jgi:hypothetical protein
VQQLPECDQVREDSRYALYLGMMPLLMPMPMLLLIPMLMLLLVLVLMLMLLLMTKAAAVMAAAARETQIRASDCRRHTKPHETKAEGGQKQ